MKRALTLSFELTAQCPFLNVYLYVDTQPVIDFEAELYL